MNNTNFINYLFEEDENPRLNPVEQHIHVGDLLYGGSPDESIDHSRALFNRMQGIHTAGHEACLDVDGGSSFIMGKEKDGRPFVSHESEKARFYDQDSITKIGKEKLLGPVLDAVSVMDNMRDGSAIRANILHGPDHTDRIYKANRVVYKQNPKARGKLAFAPDSQYEVNHRELIKNEDPFDYEQIKSSRSHAPELSLTNKKFNMSPYRKETIAKHISSAEEIIKDPAINKFAKSIIEQPDNIKNSLQKYSINVSGTTGKRSVVDYKNFVSKDPDANSWVDNNNEMLSKVFDAHHHLNHAKNHILDVFRSHQADYDIIPHGDNEHKGLVSRIAGRPAVKFVRGGPGGFSAMNTVNT